MTIADLMSAIKVDGLNADLLSVKTEFLNAPLSELVGVFADVQTNFAGLTRLCGDSFNGTSFVADVRAKILEHIENKSLRLDSSLDENDRVEFFKEWVSCVAVLYSLGEPISFKSRKAFEKDIIASTFNPLVLFHWITTHISLEKQSECLAHVWNALVLPSQNPDKDSQPSLMMRKFFEFSVQHLSIEMLEALKPCQGISTYEAKSYYKSTGEEVHGASAMARAKLCQAICKDVLSADNHVAFVEKFKQFSTKKISITDFSSGDLVAIFGRMEALRKSAGLCYWLDRDIMAFLREQDVEKLFECLLPLCGCIDSAGLIAALSWVSPTEFYQKLVTMQCEALLDKIKTWASVNNFDSQFKKVSIVYQVFENNVNPSVTGYLTQQRWYLLQSIAIDTSGVQVSQQVFIDRVKSLAPIIPLLSIRNIQYLLKEYWDFNVAKQIESPEGQYFQCFADFWSRITENVDLQLQMLKCIVDNAEKTLITNPNLCWFIALMASRVSLDTVSSGETHYCRVGLSRLRSSYKDDPKSYLSSVFAYVEIHYAQVDNSLLHAINHRRVTRLDDASKESTTGKKLTAHSKPAALITAEVAATQLFAMPVDKLTEVQAFWLKFNGGVSASKMVGNRSSFLGAGVGNSGDGVGIRILSKMTYN